ncbi:hypothetical protein ACWDR0_32470 [Streptomyces sp. NPDC003691]
MRTPTDHARAPGHPVLPPPPARPPAARPGALRGYRADTDARTAR